MIIIYEYVMSDALTNEISMVSASSSISSCLSTSKTTTSVLKKFRWLLSLICLLLVRQFSDLYRLIITYESADSGSVICAVFVQICRLWFSNLCTILRFNDLCMVSFSSDLCMFWFSNLCRSCWFQLAFLQTRQLSC